jgi:hypothetical protein
MMRLRQTRLDIALLTISILAITSSRAIADPLRLLCETWWVDPQMYRQDPTIEHIVVDLDRRTIQSGSDPATVRINEEYISWKWTSPENGKQHTYNIDRTTGEYITATDERMTRKGKCTKAENRF